MKEYSTDPKIKQMLHWVNILSIVGMAIYIFVGIVLLSIGVAIAIPNSGDVGNTLIVGLIIIVIAVVAFFDALVFANNLLHIWRLSKNWTNYNSFLINSILLFLTLNWIFAIILLVLYKKINIYCSSN